MPRTKSSRFPIVLLFACSVSGMVFAQAPKTGWESDGLRGEVQSVTEERFYLVDGHGNPIMEMKNNETKAYDRKGFSIKIAYSGGAYTSYEYDANGFLVSDRMFDQAGQLIQNRMYYFDEKGRETEIRYLDTKGSLFGKILFKYDAKGSVISTEGYNSKLAKIAETAYTLDSRGNRTQALDYKAGKVLSKKTIYGNRDKNDRITEINYDASGDGSIFSRIEYSYDAQGKLSTERKYSGDGRLLEQTVYIYDATGNKIEAITATADSNFGQSGGKMVPSGKTIWSYRYFDDHNEDFGIKALKASFHIMARGSYAPFDGKDWNKPDGLLTVQDVIFLDAAQLQELKKVVSADTTLVGDVKTEILGVLEEMEKPRTVEDMYLLQSIF